VRPASNFPIVYHNSILNTESCEKTRKCDRREVTSKYDRH